jgi:hypothetical protein
VSGRCATLPQHRDEPFSFELIKTPCAAKAIRAVGVPAGWRLSFAVCGWAVREALHS